MWTKEELAENPLDRYFTQTDMYVAAEQDKVKLTLSYATDEELIDELSARGFEVRYVP